MIRKLAIVLALIGTLSLFVGCTTTGSDTASDDEMINLDDESEIGDSADDSATSDSDSSSDVAQEDSLEDEIDASDELQDDPNQEFAEEAPAQPQEQAPEELNDEQMLAENPKEEQVPEPQVAPLEEPAQEPEPMAPETSLAEIRNIKYLANQSGGTIVIEASAPITYQVRTNADTNQFIIEVAGATLPASLKRPYILKEFDAAFAQINAYQNPGSTTARIVIQLKSGGTEPVVQAEANSLVVIPGSPAATMEVAVTPPGAEPVTEGDGSSPKGSMIDEKAAAADEKTLGARNLDEFLTGSSRFYGAPISVEVTDQDVRDVLNFVAAESGLNLIITEDVQGKVTMKLRGIPWDQALITIMQAKKLGYVRQGTVVRISTLNSLQQENNAAKQILESQKTIAPLRVKVIPVSYAEVGQLEGKVKPFLTRGRGEIVTDGRTSTLIITDTEDVLERVSRLVKELDIPPAQVMIEGKIVEAQDTFTQTLGLNWSMSGSPLIIGPGKGINGSDLTMNQQLAVTNLNTASSGVAGNLGLALRVGRFDVIGDISAALSLAEQDSMVKILSSPRVVTMNKTKASISQKGQVIFVNVLRDAQGQTTRSAASKDFSLKLEVTPQITAVGSVILEVNVKREFPGSVVDAASGARPINTREADTKVLVADGQTAVIGGIYSSDNTTTETGVPWLKDIPVLGWLFKSRQRADNRNELLIFLTPKILNIQDQAVEG